MPGQCSQLPHPLTASLLEGAVDLEAVDRSLNTGIWNGHGKGAITEGARPFLLQCRLNAGPTEAGTTLTVNYVGVVKDTQTNGALNLKMLW